MWLMKNNFCIFTSFQIRVPYKYRLAHWTLWLLLAINWFPITKVWSRIRLLFKAQYKTNIEKWFNGVSCRVDKSPKISISIYYIRTEWRIKSTKWNFSILATSQPRSTEWTYPNLVFGLKKKHFGFVIFVVFDTLCFQMSEHSHQKLVRSMLKQMTDVVE